MQNSPASPSTTRHHLIRSRWAAIGAAVAVSLGAGGLAVVSASSGPSGLTAISPCRLVDTRNGDAGGEFAAGSVTSLQVTGSNGDCVIPAGATSVTATVTVVAGSDPGFLTVWPDGPMPNSSVVNWDGSVVAVANTTLVALAADGSFKVMASAATDLIVDIAGYHTPGTEGGAGSTGATGATGATGPEGAEGPQGVPGVQGAPGENGIPGEDGIPGEQGPAGQDAGQFDRVVTVSASGADHTTLAGAVSEITAAADATASAPYVIVIGPGTYAAGVVMPAHTSVFGAGASATTLTGAVSPLNPSQYIGFAVSAAAGTTISDLSIVVESGMYSSAHAVILLGDYASLTLERVNINTQSFFADSYGVGDSSTPEGATVTATNTTIITRAVAGTATGIAGVGVAFTDSTIDTQSDGWAYGITSQNTVVTITDSTITASNTSASPSRALSGYGLSLTVTGSTIAGDHALNGTDAAGASRVVASILDGAVVTQSGLLAKCAASFTADLVPLGEYCQTF